MRTKRVTSKPNLSRNIMVSGRALSVLLMRQQIYMLLALVLTVIFYELIFWSLNLSLAGYLLTAPFISIGERLAILASSFTSLFTQPSSPLGVLLLGVSLIQGISLAALIFLIRKERQQMRSMAGIVSGTGIAGILAVLGLGCAACGTSLLAPVITFFFASSSIALSEQIGEIAAVLALVVALINLYFIGLKLSRYTPATT